MRCGGAADCSRRVHHTSAGAVFACGERMCVAGHDINHSGSHYHSVGPGKGYSIDCQHPRPPYRDMHTKLSTATPHERRAALMSAQMTRQALPTSEPRNCGLYGRCRSRCLTRQQQVRSPSRQPMGQVHPIFASDADRSRRGGPARRGREVGRRENAARSRFQLAVASDGADVGRSGGGYVQGGRFSHGVKTGSFVAP